MIDLADIENARNRIAPHVRRTPVVAFDRLHRPLDTGARLSLKLECLQVTGSFKARGAMNRLLGMNEPPGPAGIVTASGGNHGLAVARTAAAAGVPASIYVPTGVSLSKIEKMRAWGASVAFAGSVFDEAAEAAHAHCRRTGAVYFHPFADPLVVAGQGTLGLEIAEDVPDMDAILIAIGGGQLPVAVMAKGM